MKERIGGKGNIKYQVTHSFDSAKRAKMNYPQGVGIGRSPFFDFIDDPWNLITSMIRLFTVAHQFERFDKFAREEVHKRILDIGCYYGEQKKIINRMRKGSGSSFEYVGIDIDEDKKIVAKQIDPDIDFRLVDIRYLKTYELGYYDWIICSEVVEHLPKAQGLKLILDAYDMLNPNGLLVLTVATNLLSTFNEDDIHVHEWNGTNLKESIEAADRESMIILDDFHINIPIKHLVDLKDPRTKRIPFNLMRTPLSYNSTEEGTVYVMIIRKEQDDSV